MHEGVSKEEGRQVSGTSGKTNTLLLASSVLSVA